MAVKPPESIKPLAQESHPANLSTVYSLFESNNPVKESWYYFPAGADGPVMLRQTWAKAGAKDEQRVLKQNEQGNFYYDKDKAVIHIENYHCWNSDLSVFQLPCDGHSIREFISKIQGRPYEIDYVNNRKAGLLVIANKERQNGKPQVVNQFNMLEEEYFQYNLPVGAKVIDNRDAMHKRGWTYFTITGEFNGKKINGKGRMPFIYKQCEENRPWLKMRSGGEEIVDIAFIGLGRPWMGLHTIDVVRRDAAQRQVPFDTKLSLDGKKAIVTLKNLNSRIVYTIDMQTDVVEKITFAGEKTGMLQFEYMQDIDNASHEFASPVTGYKKDQNGQWFFEKL